MGVRAAFPVFLLFVATVKAGEGGVTFWRKEFTMTCPETEEIEWFKEKDKDKIEDETKRYITMEYKKKGFYHCVSKNGDDPKKKYYFYVQGKVCDHCYELDSLVFLMAIVIDILVTICVMFITYKCTKKKGPAGLTHASKPPPRSGGRGGPAPAGHNSAYEELNRHTRANDTYSGLVNRTG